jgi:glycosyltransferase involved in cell wall biosynthesis
MRLLMVSGDRQVTIGERGPFHSMQREFSRYFERIDVICPRPEGEIKMLTIHGNVHFHPAPCGRAGMVNYIEGKGTDLIRHHGHSLIVSHDYGWFYNGFGSARLTRATGVPYLSEIHHVPGYPVAADWRERFDKLVARFYIGWAKNRAAAFRVVNSEQMPALLCRWSVPLSKIIFLPSLYVDFEVFYPPAEPVEPEQDIVFVGRMVNNKGLDRIVDAITGLHKRGYPVKALFVGKGPLAAGVRRRAESLGIGDSLRFIEWVDSPEDLADIYRASRVCVCASTCEGGPRFTVEAMACGTPVVSTLVGVMGDLLGDGKGGRLCGFDTRSLTDSLEEVLRDEQQRQKMGQGAFEATRPYEYARALGLYANGLRKLVGEPEVTL